MGKQEQKRQLRTVRFTAAEAGRIEKYLRANPIFESFSSLARVATLTFIGQQHRFRLEPVSRKSERRQRPRFLWDYELSEQQVQEILSRPGLCETKKFLMERILTEGRFEEVFDYLTLKQLTRHFDRLSLPEQKKRHWGYALNRWSGHD
jgi:hypothetical protein